MDKQISKAEIVDIGVASLNNNGSIAGGDRLNGYHDDEDEEKSANIDEKMNDENEMDDDIDEEEDEEDAENDNSDLENSDDLKQSQQDQDDTNMANGSEDEEDDDDCEIMYISKDENEEKNDSQSEDKSSKCNISNTTNSNNKTNKENEKSTEKSNENTKRKRVYVEETEISDDECVFPEYLKGAVVRGKCIPINKRTWKEINIDGNDAILDCASQVVPLMIKKPDVFPLKLPPEEDEKPKETKKQKKKSKTDTPGEEAEQEEIDEEKEGEEDEDEKDAEDSENVECNEEKQENANNRSLLTIPSFGNSSVGKFLMGIGLSRAKEWFHKDAIKQLQKTIRKEGEHEDLIEELKKQQHYLSQCKAANSVFNFEQNKCHMCEFKTESATILEGHYFIPHLSNRKEYKCNFCLFVTRDPRTIMHHFQVTHRKQCIIEAPPQLYECPTCPYESSQKAKAMTHFAKCLKSFEPEKVCFTSDIESEYPTITPKPITQDDIKVYEDTIAALRPIALSGNVRAPFNFVPGLPRGLQYQILMQQQQLAQQNRLYQMRRGQIKGINNLQMGTGNGTNFSKSSPELYNMLRAGGGHSQLLSIQQQKLLQGQNLSNLQNQRGRLMPGTSGSIIIPKGVMNAGKGNLFNKGNDSLSSKGGTFVICEICDGYIKDLEQLRTHMQWIHKVKIHPKMLASRPPLNCQKCQWRFFTDQGLERHLLGAHGLVTSNMQDLVNQNKDGGRCTICGRVFANKLVSHMNQVHKITLRPAHLSYKCTVCSATFNLYRLFENHVYMDHSGSVKRMVKT